MALKPCRDCGGTVSTKAGKCPHCAAERPAQGSTGFAAQNTLTVIIAVVLMLAVMVVFVGVCGV